MARYLALYMGAEDSAAQKTWNALTPDMQAQRSAEAFADWGHWVEANKAAIVDIGSPLGKTLLASPDGITPMRNGVAAYVIVEAASHEAAAALFIAHPHFTLFPGTGVEIMACLPMPKAPQ